MALSSADADDTASGRTYDEAALRGLADDLIARLRRAGADAADVLVVSGASLSASVRLGEVEDVERSEAQDLGLRAFVGKRQAIVSSSDLGPRACHEMIERVIAMVRLAPEDPYCGLAEPELLSRQFPSLDVCDDTRPAIPALIDAAKQAEAAARAVDGITNSEGAGASSSHSRMVLVTSHGFAGSYGASSFSLSCSMLAGSGTAMQRDYEYSSARHYTDLAAPAVIGQQAAGRAVARLNPRKVKTAQLPVVFAPRVSNSLLGHLAGAISGVAVARGTSFLKHRLGQQLFVKGVTIHDDPHRLRGLRSKPFDGEGVANKPMRVVEDGVLTTWLLDSATARQLGMASTGHAARGPGSNPSPSATNFYMAAGKVSVASLISDIVNGVLVTELIGMGVNPVTGDYSRGASGFWIENGAITYPVSEITIAGNLLEMFATLTPADDLEFRYGVDAPSIRIEGMTVAGE